MTNEEKKLLHRLNKGMSDGFVGESRHTSGGSSIWMIIKNGIPKRLKQGPSRKLFNGKENESVEGVLHILKEWVTDEDKLQFLREFGWLTKDANVLAYSAKFKTMK